MKRGKAAQITINLALGRGGNSVFVQLFLEAKKKINFIIEAEFVA